MSNDRYQEIREALAMGPTPGPWRCEHETGGGHDCWMIYAGDRPKSGGIVGYYTHTGPRHIPHVRPNVEAVAIANHIAACDPDTIRDLLAERDRLAAALEAAREDGWRPIETAPKDGTRVMLGNEHGAWIADWRPVYQSGYRPENPWASSMLNHWHIASEHRHKRATHWRHLPAPPAIDQARGKGGGEVEGG